MNTKVVFKKKKVSDFSNFPARKAKDSEKGQLLTPSKERCPTKDLM